MLPTQGQVRHSSFSPFIRCKNTPRCSSPEFTELSGGFHHNNRVLTFSIVHIGPETHFVSKNWWIESSGVNNKTVAVPHFLVNFWEVSDFPDKWSIAISASGVIFLCQLCSGQLLLQLLHLYLLLAAFLLQADNPLVQLPRDQVALLALQVWNLHNVTWSVLTVRACYCQTSWGPPGVLC